MYAMNPPIVFIIGGLTVILEGILLNAGYDTHISGSVTVDPYEVSDSGNTGFCSLHNVPNKLVFWLVIWKAKLLRLH